MGVDFESAKNLELVGAFSPGDKRCHLLSTLDYTKTKMGRRLLRVSILQPLTDAQQIEVRQACLEELLSKDEGGLDTVRTAIQEGHDLDALLSSLVQVQKIEGAKDAERRVRLLISLKQCIHALHATSEALLGLQHPLFAVLAKDTSSPGLVTIAGIIGELVSDDLLSTLPLSKASLTQEQRAYAIRSGINPLMEVARRTFKECLDDIHEYAQALQQHYGLPLQVRWKPPRGYTTKNPFN